MKKSIAWIMILTLLFVFGAQSVAFAGEMETAGEVVVEERPLPEPEAADESGEARPDAEEAPEITPQADYINIAEPGMERVPQGAVLNLRFRFQPNTWSGWYWDEADYFVTEAGVTGDWKVAQYLNAGINEKISGFTHVAGTTSQTEWVGKLDTIKLAPGEYKIWVAVTATTWTSFYETRTFTVLENANLVNAGSVKLNRTSYTMDIGKRMQLRAEVLPANTTNKNITWKSENTATATVDSNGKVTAVRQGKVAITATTANGKTAKCVVTVRKPAVSIELDKASVSIAKGSTAQLKVIKYNPSTVYPKTITWKTNNAGVATVDKNGRVKGVGKGVAYIYAKTWNGVFDKCRVAVK